MHDHFVAVDARLQPAIDPCFCLCDRQVWRKSTGCEDVLISIAIDPSHFPVVDE